MKKPLLITQCLQKDFIQQIGKYDPLPNLLHIGHSESHRLLGDDPENSPINQVIQWAYRQKPSELGILHIRDWHDESDENQLAHLNHFGVHCLKNTEGAEFIFDLPKEVQNRPVDIVNSLTLNDFEGTNIEKILDPLKNEEFSVGLMGVWTEAKITYLSYELRTRYPKMKIAICPALCASSTRAQHYGAITQLERLLGVHVIESLGDFIGFLGGKHLELPQKIKTAPNVHFDGKKEVIDQNAIALIHYLFRDCLEISIRLLDGGFSGNYVFGCNSLDHQGRQQASHVLKIGPRHLIAKERIAFEQVELVLGNTAPQIVDFADSKDLGAIKYRYASMGGGESNSLQKIYMQGAPQKEVSRVLNEVFNNQLGRLYFAAEKEGCNLLEYYGFRGDMAPNVQKLVNNLLITPSEEDTVPFFNKRKIANPAKFYINDVEDLKSEIREYRYFSYVHGDLNGANIILDSHKNVWLIDFFHTHYGHVLKDLIKLENDLLYIFTPIKNEKDLKLACEFTDYLLNIKDLGEAPKFSNRLSQHKVFGRTAKSVRALRKHYTKILHLDLDPVQLMIGQLRYAVHTLSFDEPNIWQRRWALYTASVLSASINERLRSLMKLRVAWLSAKKGKGRIGLTILPGRKDRDRNLLKDIEELKNEGVKHVYAVLTNHELVSFGVPKLLSEYKAHGIQAQQVSLPDGQAPTPSEMRKILTEVNASIEKGENVLFHCVGGLGRSGTFAAACLIDQGVEADQAIAQVRSSRSPRAIETKAQETFLRKFKP